MSQNNLIRKSDKKFIRSEKARIRKQFFDVKKQNELIGELYKKFIRNPVVTQPAKEGKVEKAEAPKVKKEIPKVKSKK